VVDDLHWLDPASRDVLLFALRRLDRDAIACLLTTRADAPAPAERARAELRQRRDGRRHRPGR
jgi:predicted ATPase